MQRKYALLQYSLAKRLTFTAVFAALCFIGTFIITIPLPNGYFNVGDVFVLLSGWLLGPIYGAIAAAVGSAIADLLSGFAIYAPATFIIKGLDAAIAWLLWKTVKLVWKKQSLDALCRVISAVAAETVMVFGYFVFECALYSFAGGAAALLGNAMQGALCTVCAVLLISALCAVPSVKKLFPPLDDK